MPTHTLSRTAGPTFSYLDSGPPFKSSAEYATLIIFNGLTFNAALFERLFPLASNIGFRIIAINRRPYSGSTTYSETELHTIQHASLEEKSKSWDTQGIDLAFLVSELIEGLELRDVALVGWSLGSAFVLFILNACSSLDSKSQEILVTHVRSVVIWDPPSTALGFSPPKNAYLPLFDETIPKEERPKRFSQYVASYFTHTNISPDSDTVSINYRPDDDKAPSVDGMSADDLARIVDPSAVKNGDSAVGEMSFVEGGKILLQSKVRKALLNSATRDTWRHTSFSCIYGDRNAWYIPVTIQGLHQLVKEANDPTLKISFKIIKGANHLVMWDSPELAIGVLAECLRDI